MVLNPVQDHSPVGADGAIVGALGGYFDPFGSGDASARQQPISLTGVVWGEDTYLVDEAGNYVVDEAGDFVIAGSSEQMLRSQIAALREKVRKRGTLWRIRLDDNVREWKTARFLRMSQPQVQRDRVFMATVTCEFESAMTNWHAETASAFSANAVAGDTPTYFVVENPGATVTDAVFTVTRTSGTISNVVLFCNDLGIEWSWSGNTLGVGQVLVVDAGSQGVARGGVDAYTQFSLLGSSPGFMTIEPGSWLFGVYLTGGNASVQMSFYAQYP